MTVPSCLLLVRSPVRVLVNTFPLLNTSSRHGSYPWTTKKDKFRPLVPPRPQKGPPLLPTHLILLVRIRKFLDGAVQMVNPWEVALFAVFLALTLTPARKLRNLCPPRKQRSVPFLVVVANPLKRLASTPPSLLDIGLPNVRDPLFLLMNKSRLGRLVGKTSESYPGVAQVKNVSPETRVRVLQVATTNRLLPLPARL